MRRYAIQSFADQQTSEPPSSLRDGWQVLDLRRLIFDRPEVKDRFRGPSALQAAIISMESLEQDWQRLSWAERHGIELSEHALDDH